jgi:hypothetical protein
MINCVILSGAKDLIGTEGTPLAMRSFGRAALPQDNSSLTAYSITAITSS